MPERAAVDFLRAWLVNFYCRRAAVSRNMLIRFTVVLWHTACHYPSSRLVDTGTGGCIAEGGIDK
jgi:hypothetical protein